MNSQNFFTVSGLTSAIKKILEQRYPFINVAGEITNLRKPASGHCYFTLKDSQAQIKAVLFKMQCRYLEKPPKEGQMVVCKGRISVYEPRGDYQLIVDTMDFHGSGALQLSFEKLKTKLAQEGLFDQTDKKKIPPFPHHITLITSPTGAAVHDFIKIAVKRFPGIHISIFPVPVQGETAAEKMRQAIRDVNALLDTDIIVLTRGGGSIEDLWAYNDEQLARTIKNSSIPVVSAVGHEIDFTIADFAADLRAPTPSGAAEMILPDGSGIQHRIQELSRRICQAVLSRLDSYQGQLLLYNQQLASAAHPIDSLLLRLDHLSANLQHAINTIISSASSRLGDEQNRLQNNNPSRSLTFFQNHVHELENKLNAAVCRLLKEKTQNLKKTCALLDAVSPLATLARGYAIARKKNKKKSVLCNTNQVRKGETIEVILFEGNLECEIVATQTNTNIDK